MTTLYLDTFSGISGDMLLGALLDLGLDFAAFKAQLAKLKVTGFELTAKRVAHSSIYGTDFDVVLDQGTKDQGFVETKHHHDHSEDQHHHHQAAGHHHHGEVRHLKDIEAIINASELSTTVKAQANQVFADIAQAEAVVHAMPVDEVHFHEVGALDSIVDIVGIFVALEMLGIDEVRASELVDGTGSLKWPMAKCPYLSQL